MTNLDGLFLPSKAILDNNIKKLDRWTKQMSSFEDQIKKYSTQVNLPEKDLGSSLKKLISITRYLNDYSSMEKELKSIEIDSMSKSLEKDSLKLNDLRSQINECPLCGRSDTCSK
jgi:DNA repair exonuclease SbcCD ATPase subunit